MSRSTAPFPLTRLRRTRKMEALRGLVRENHLCAADLIWPVFVREGENARTEISSMPGVARLSIDVLLNEAETAHRAGIGTICLFPFIEQELKTSDCAGAWDENNLINRATMYKDGLAVGEITLYIRKVSDTPHRELSTNCAIQGG